MSASIAAMMARGRHPGICVPIQQILLMADGTLSTVLQQQGRSISPHANTVSPIIDIVYQFY